MKVTQNRVLKRLAQGAVLRDDLFAGGSLLSSPSGIVKLGLELKQAFLIREDTVATSGSDRVVAGALRAQLQLTLHREVVRSGCQTDGQVLQSEIDLSQCFGQFVECD